MAVSRLDRLFILLDTGTTPVTRKAAAQQLGEVVKLHPHELHSLLTKVLIHLRSTNWDTRIAAGQAVEAIVKNVPEWNPPPRPKQEDGCESPMDELPVSDRLRFDRFDICRLLKNGASLLGSAGAEFEVQDDTSARPKNDMNNVSLFGTMELSPIGNAIMPEGLTSCVILGAIFLIICWRLNHLVMTALARDNLKNVGTLILISGIDLVQLAKTQRFAYLKKPGFCLVECGDQLKEGSRSMWCCTFASHIQKAAKCLEDAGLDVKEWNKSLGNHFIDASKNLKASTFGSAYLILFSSNNSCLSTMRDYFQLFGNSLHYASNCVRASIYDTFKNDLRLASNASKEFADVINHR